MSTKSKAAIDRELETPWVDGLTMPQVLRETARRYGDHDALAFPPVALLVRLTLPTAVMWPWLALLAVGCTYLPYLLFSVGVARVASSRAVVVATVEPVLATAIGVAFYGERLGVLGAVGAAAVVAASTLVALGPGGRATA